MFGIQKRIYYLLLLILTITIISIFLVQALTTNTEEQTNSGEPSAEEKDITYENPNDASTAGSGTYTEADEEPAQYEPPQEQTVQINAISEETSILTPSGTI